jgi:RNA polymerase sigma-70 factor (ECF subfamily)
VSGPLDRLGGEVKTSWQRFLDVFEPLRPELYRYCRYLTRSPWDAEDLVQDAMARAFATLGTLFGEVPEPRAWLFRVASNLWIDRTRRARLEHGEPVAEAGAAPAPELRAPREAAGTLIAQLAPQERAAVVLKDVFDFSLDEIAAALTTTVGAVKAALHRGRGKLTELEGERLAVTPPPVLDAFCAAFNARDLDGLTALLLDSVTLEFPGHHSAQGVPATRGALGATMFHAHAFITPEWRHGVVEDSARFELRTHRGELLVLAWWQHADGEAVRGFSLVEHEDEHIARIRTYFHTPEALGELCRELGLPCRTNGYRFW